MSPLRTSTPSPAPAPLLVPVGPHKGRPPLPLSRLLTLIGSAPSARLYLPSKAVSRCHAVVVNAGSGLFVRDLASRTQTRLNGQPVNEADLREGDVLQVGPFTFRFTDPTAPPVRPPRPPGPVAMLEVNGLPQPLLLRARATLIGRRETADVSLTENAASSAHALIVVSEGKHVVRDLDSRTGTFVNGVKVHEHALSAGDWLRVGETSFQYVLDEAAAQASAAAPGALHQGPITTAPLSQPEPRASLPEPEPANSPSPHLQPENGSAGLLEIGSSALDPAASGTSPGEPESNQSFEPAAGTRRIDRADAPLIEMAQAEVDPPGH